MLVLRICLLYFPISNNTEVTTRFIETVGLKKPLRNMFTANYDLLGNLADIYRS